MSQDVLLSHQIPTGDRVTDRYTSEPEQPGSEFTVYQQTAPIPRISDMRSAARDGHDQAPRRRRRRPFSTLISFQPDMDDLFLRPGAAVGPLRGPARHRAGKRFRGINGNLFLAAVTAVAVVAAFSGVWALAGFFNRDVPAPRPGTPPLALPLATASASASPSATVSGSPSAPAARLNQVRVSPVMAPGTQDASPRMSQMPAVTSPTPTVAASPTATSGQLAVTVSYAVDEQVGDSFEAEVDVTNEGSVSISGWQIVVALPGDQVTEIANATGYESNHILLLQPTSPGSTVAPGATLRVRFVAQGTRTTPEICSFDSVACG